VKLLLDAHALLWWLADDRRLGRAARAAIADPSNVVLVSAATTWEVEIKAALGRIEPRDLDVVAEVAGSSFIELPISARHARHAARLPRHHGDPFDRILIAQTQLEDLTCVSRDPLFVAYDLPLLW
jgi:PIN domain nuclease of toxin-antitoxin system